MTIQDLGAIGELLGSIAVLATLVYLALQTRQNTVAIAAQLDAARLNSVQEFNLAAATSTELLETLNGDRVEPITIEQARLGHYWSARFFHLAWTFLQLRRGVPILSSEARMAVRVVSYFNDFRSVEAWWEEHGRRMPVEFVEWVEEQRAKAA